MLGQRRVELMPGLTSAMRPTSRLSQLSHAAPGPARHTLSVGRGVACRIRDSHVRCRIAERTVGVRQQEPTRLGAFASQMTDLILHEPVVPHRPSPWPRPRALTMGEGRSNRRGRPSSRALAEGFEDAHIALFHAWEVEGCGPVLALAAHPHRNPSRNSPEAAGLAHTCSPHPACVDAPVFSTRLRKTEVKESTCSSRLTCRLLAA